LKLAENVLGGIGYDLVCARGAAQGLALAGEAVPDALVVDLLMPEIDGYEFIDRFRQIEGCAHVPVIVWTVKEIDAGERTELQKSSQAIVRKSGQGGMQSLIAEIERQLSRAPVPAKKRAGLSA